VTTTPARILIVDDDETVLQTFAKALSLEGYDVRTAASPLIGLQSVQ
jgi:DNA-binding response OmpR family regulator